MRKLAITLFMAAVFFVQFTARAAPGSVDLVLTDPNVSFTSATNISMRAVFRNIGETNLSVAGLVRSLSIVWDGTEYKRNPNRSILYNGPLWLGSESGFEYNFSISDNLISPEKLTFGRHTIAVRVMSSESNTLIVFIVPFRKRDPNVTSFQRTISRGQVVGSGYGGAGGGTNRGGF
ncbi:MAG TPA: hypothetical protein VFY06_04265 [Verrucomicrobiae bacterium]|nr:hypothetical protein [Verrucomicrobiae bacterium]